MISYLHPSLTQQASVKRDWLIAFILQAIANFVAAAFNRPTITNPQTLPWWFGLCIMSIVAFLFYYFIYYCAYKKQGTKLLLFMLITTPISKLLAFIVPFLSRPSHVPLALRIATELVIVFFLLQSFRLFWINKQLQATTHNR